MTRKDYIAIAEAIRDERAAWDVSGDSAPAFLALHNVARNIADVFEKDNLRFDRARFMEAALGKDDA